ncbi:isochorismatase family protein [Fictibacillus enclensis]|uniref:isochorismatase family protein n=1 Tax=Fictibacillus enclensis TaxID=1017270 RepID=UPI0025A1F3E2|nr:isochorismatase family protein [Fictibacillus enclensis]MDM5336621.1 isochorismatase family protein [Fictibacillus enclensis]
MLIKQFPWEDSLTAEDQTVIKKGGYGKERGLGKKPLLVIVDPQYNYVGEDKPIVEQLDQWPSGGGREAWNAIRIIQKLKVAFKENELPVLYTKNVQKKTLKFDSFAVKADRDNTKYLADAPETEIVKELTPDPEDLVLEKSYASAFYGTPLLSYLIKMQVDSLILVGGSSSGCIRALAVDAVTRNFNVAVVMDATYDRIQLSHKATLLDLWMKYCDVVNSDQINNYLNELKKEDYYVGLAD